MVVGLGLDAEVAGGAVHHEEAGHLAARVLAILPLGLLAGAVLVHLGNPLHLLGGTGPAPIVGTPRHPVHVLRRLLHLHPVPRDLVCLRHITLLPLLFLPLLLFLVLSLHTFLNVGEPVGHLHHLPVPAVVRHVLPVVEKPQRGIAPDHLLHAKVAVDDAVYFGNEHRKLHLHCLIVLLIRVIVSVLLYILVNFDLRYIGHHLRERLPSGGEVAAV
mmetsp:Transcript_40375/g.121662  ORF Transcript_40375/g.121662 Transcript_40375/m.121662 type:complete len:216 (+) Transcript_40375:904-1551(+)